MGFVLMGGERVRYMGTRWAIHVRRCRCSSMVKGDVRTMPPDVAARCERACGAMTCPTQPAAHCNIAVARNSHVQHLLVRALQLQIAGICCMCMRCVPSMCVACVRRA